jgi:hypothetical protein
MSINYLMIEMATVRSLEPVATQPDICVCALIASRACELLRLLLHTSCMEKIPPPCSVIRDIGVTTTVKARSCEMQSREKGKKEWVESTFVAHVLHSCETITRVTKCRRFSMRSVMVVR